MGSELGPTEAMVAGSCGLTGTWQMSHVPRSRRGAGGHRNVSTNQAKTTAVQLYGLGLENRRGQGRAAGCLESAVVTAEALSAEPRRQADEQPRPEARGRAESKRP